MLYERIMQTSNLTASQTVATTVLDYSETAAIFQRHRIDFCCRGHLSIEQAARERGVELAALMKSLGEAIEIRRVGENQAFATDVRIVCATHRDLAERVRDGWFRQDLFYRLKVLSVHVPPLRERRADILPIAERLLAAEHTRARGFTAAAQHALLHYDWPGHVRELQNAVKHGVALAAGPLVDAADLPEEMLLPPSPASSPAPAAPAATSLRSLVDVERDHIIAVLGACGGSQADAARILGIARNTLWRKLRKYGET